MKLPNVVKYLILANIVMWVLTSLLQVRGIHLNNVLALFYVEHPLFMPHQFITYMFMHEGFMHIFFNMFALFMFGRIMALTWGEKKFLIFYIVCGIGAAITQELGQAMGVIEANACTLGASGAVFGVLLAFGMTYPNEKLFIIPFPFPIKAKYLIIGYIFLEVFQFLGNPDGVAHLAHLGGMLFGYLLILFWRRNPDKDINNWQRTAFRGQRRATNHRSNTGGVYHANFTGGSNSSTNANAEAGRRVDYEYNERKRQQTREIDEILDKIRKNGWDALSKEDQQKIIEASKQL